MELRRFPTTNIQASLVTLGTMTFGGQTDEQESLRIMDHAVDHGVNLFDTADVYNRGQSERIVGKGLKGRRQRILLATKVRGQMGDDPNDQGLSRRHILSAVEQSLQRLETDYIDIYYLHQPDYLTPLEESLSAMNSLVQQGKIRYIGISNYAAWQAADILAICDKHGYARPVISQNVYNLLTRGIEAEFLPFLRAHPLALTVYNPVAGGLLTGKHHRGKPDEDSRFGRDSNYYRRYWSEENFEALEELRRIAADLQLQLLDLAYLWLKQQPQVTTILCGVSRLSQLEDNLRALNGPALPDEALARMDALWHRLAGTRFAYNR